MKRDFCRTIVLAGLLLTWAHSQAIAQNASEPTIDQRFQNAVDPAPEADLPLLNPHPVNRPEANLQADNPAPRSVSGPAYLGVIFNTQFRAAVVRTVNPGSPAEQAGLQPGDVIESLHGRPINSYQDVLDVVATMRSGDVLQMEFSRRITARTQAALDNLPAASQRSVGYAPDLSNTGSIVNPAAEHELLPTPANAQSRTRAPAPQLNRNPAPQYQNRFERDERRNDSQNNGQFDSNQRLRSRGTRRR